MSKKLVELLKIAAEIETSRALNQQLIMDAYKSGRDEALSGGIRAYVKLNKKRQIKLVSNYNANATVIIDE